MKIHTSIANDITVVSLSGRFDSAAVSQFKNEIAQTSAATRYVIEMNNVDYIDSSGLGSLVALLRQTQARKGEIKIARLSQKIAYAFELTRLHRIFDIYDDTQVALKSFGSVH